MEEVILCSLALVHKLDWEVMKMNTSIPDCQSRSSFNPGWDTQ
jgi:hypothetical protein